MTTNAGTITLTAGSATVSGAGTTFNTDLKTGDFIVATAGGVSYTLPVLTVESATSLTLINKYDGTTFSGLAWTGVSGETQMQITSALGVQVTEALRGQNYDKSNWQSVYTVDGDITVTLPDNTQYTGPSWKKLSGLLTGFDDDISALDHKFEPIAYDKLDPNTFVTGATISAANQALAVDATKAMYYVWTGALPKAVPPNTDPTADNKWIPVSNATLRGVLSAPDGANAVGEVQSVAGFSQLIAVQGRKAHLRGWYPNSTVGAGDYYYDTTIIRSKHDGGKYISPTVPYTTAQAFVAGTGETNATGAGVWVRAGVSSALKGEWYGMLTGTVASPMLIAMAKTAGVEGLGVEFPAGNFVANATATFLMDGSATGNVKYVKGAGSRSTLFTVDTTALNTYAIRITGSIGATTATHDMVYVVGFRMRGNGSRAGGNIYTGFGLMIENTLEFTMLDVRTENFERGATLQNSLYGLAIACRLQASKSAVVMRRSGLTTGVNAMEFLRCDFSDNAIYCVQETESHAVKYTNCTFEGNGGKFDNDGTTIIGSVACVQTDTTGAAGGVGTVFDTCYFEANSCVDVKVLVNSNRNQLSAVRNCIFNKTRTDMTGPRIQMVSTLSAMTGGLKATLQLDGNRFFSGTNNADASFPDVEVTGFTALGYGHGEILDYNNVFTANTAIAKDAIVVHKKAPDDGILCRGLSAGGFTAAQSRNVVSATRQGVGVYRVITNQLTSLFDWQITLDNVGFATISTAENNEAFTVSCFNGSGAAADVNFRLRAKLI